jgi:hypothetical protein
MCKSVTYLKVNNLRYFVLLLTLTKIDCLQPEYPCYFLIRIQLKIWQNNHFCLPYINFKILLSFLRAFKRIGSVLPNFWFAVLFWLRKVTTDCHTLANVNTESPDDRYTKLDPGRFIMLSVIPNIYNKKTKGPTLMKLFTATGKLKIFFDN